MLLPVSPIPEICISLAPPELPVQEPISPFAPLSPSPVKEDFDSFRSALLSPPPIISPSRAPRLSPLNPSESNGKGLDQERFESLLRASKERNSTQGSKRSTDLRKEVTLKAHKSKQMERRALFLSKIQAPPSPSAACMPKTPPESPSVFHYTLPSPGLVSPLALFETLEDPQSSIREPWVEQVEWVPSKTAERGPAPRVRVVKSVPSLDQITERLKSQGHVPAAPAVRVTARRPVALPAFLQAHAKETNVHVVPEVKAKPPRPTLPIGVGRLQMPKHTPSSLEVSRGAHSPPKSPQPQPKLEVKTTVIPYASMRSPDQLTEENLSLLNVRERSAQDMLSTLRRRTLGAAISLANMGPTEEKKDKRNSAPAELQRRHRVGFMHPILLRPGAF